MNPYEYHNDMLGVQARFLVDGRDAHECSLRIVKDRTFRERIKTGIIKRLRPRNQYTPTLVGWKDLPPDWQKKLIEVFGEPTKRAKQSLFEKYFELDSMAVYFYANYRLKNGVGLPPETQDEYALNASVLNLIDDMFNRRKEFRQLMKGTVKEVWEITANDAELFRRIKPHTLPTGRRLRDKLNEYTRGGLRNYEVLIHKNWCNVSALKLDDDTMGLLDNMFATQDQKPTATEVARQYGAFKAGYIEIINNETGECYDPNDFSDIGEGTIRKWLAKWSSKIATHHKRGGDRQKLINLFKPYHSLMQPKYAGSIISIDDRQPPFEYAKGKRLWFYNAIDLGSEAFTCWVHGKDKAGIIIEFYRQLMRNYTEWGLPMPAEIEAEMNLNSSFVNTFLKDGAMFQYTHIEGNNARAKRIERYYGNLRYDYEKQREGWLARPFALSESNQIRLKPVPFVPYEKIIEGCLKDIETWNNTEHSQIKGKTRWEVFIEMQNPNVRPTNWRAILPHLGYKTQTSCNKGIIRLNNGEFVLGNEGEIYFGEKLVMLMDWVEGKELDIYWMDDNDGGVMRALVYLRGGEQCICEAIAKPRYNRARIERTEEDDRNIELMCKYVETIEGYRRSQMKLIDTVTVIDNRPKTLNGKFKIRELKVSNTPDPVTEDSFTARQADFLEEEVEVMPELIEDDLNGFETGFNSSLKDRF